MTAVALTRFTQGAPGIAGQAFVGTIAGGAVTVANNNNADVASWRITMLYVPPGSAVATGVLDSGNGATPSASFTPDVPGPYRVMVEVFESSGQSGARSTDIRCFGVRNTRGFIAPPYQKNPDPLPLPSSGLPTAKPDEQNYDGQVFGWAGNGSDGQLNHFLTAYDDGHFATVGATPFSPTALSAPVSVVNLSTIGGNAVVNLPSANVRVGQRFRVVAFGGAIGNIVTINAPGGHTIAGLASIVVLAGASAEIEFLGGTSWTLIGARRMREERTLVGTAATTPVQAGFTSIGAAYVDLGEFPNLLAVTWRAVIETTNALDACEVRLFNATTLAVVGSSLKSSASLVPAIVAENAITLAAGANIYEAQIRLATTGAPNLATCKQAQLIFHWLQP